MHTLVPRGNLERPINMHVFAPWEEAGGPRENPRMHGKNIQTPCRKTTDWDLKPEPSCLQGNGVNNCTIMQPHYHQSYLIIITIDSFIFYPSWQPPGLAALGRGPYCPYQKPPHFNGEIIL
ncbi:hypothetical protein ILYODFUR_026743 [Ilyodon furcidens]|uniref:Uncharacterized protein n=1 Tax=Ilyodon furcidens TaxID=33524 RepID=A0ABV0SPG7_9TELE